MTHYEPCQFKLRGTRIAALMAGASICAAAVAQVDVGPAATGDAQGGPDSGGGSKSVRFAMPRVSVAATFTDNLGLSSAAKQTELTTEISTGIRLSRDTGRVKGFLDYALSGRFYSQNTSAAGLQNNLTAFGMVELVEKRAFIDLGAGIARQTISANGAQAAAGQFTANNQTEISNYRISPYLRGNLAQIANYELRYSFDNSSSNSAAASQVSNKQLSLGLTSSRSGAKLGWSLNANTASSSFGLGRTTETDLLSGGLNYTVTPQFNLSASVGRESNNYTTLDKVSSTTTGMGLNWSPTPLTQVSLSRQIRPFGESFSINLSTRGPRTVWQFSDLQDVTNTPAQLSFGSLGNVYDIYFAQFEAVEPDPLKRAALVEAFLQANGISPKTSVIGGFLTSAVSLQRRQNLSLALLGVRSTVTFLLTRTATNRVDTVSTALDDLSNGTRVDQTGFSVNWGHRLTPQSALNVNYSAQNSSDSAGLQDTNTRSASVGLSTQLGLRTTATVNARRVVSESRLTPYNETAVTGAVTVQF